MKNLSGLDASFLYLETPETPMHVGSLHLYELPKGFRGSFHRLVREHIATRLHLAAIFTRRLASMPLQLGHPGWVEAPVDLSFHIRKVPGRALTVMEVEDAVAKLHGVLMDRTRPLWEFHVFDSVEAPEGLQASGRIAAFYSKIHHAALDGKGGTVLANAILDLTPIPRKVPPPEPHPAAAPPGTSEMLGSVVSNSVAQLAKLARSLPQAAASLGRSVARSPGSALSLAPRTMFNVPVSTERIFATATVPFDEARLMANALGVSFNDIVLWLCATALRTYVADHGTLPRKSLVAAMPVSLRDAGNAELNTQATMSLVDLGTQFADPFKRMNAIHASTGRVKGALVNMKSVVPTDYPSLLAPWYVSLAGKALIRTYGRSGLAISNVVISNVPGPAVPLYLAGARMLTYHPLSIILHGLAANITVQTYAGRVDFGIVGCRQALPHLRELARGIEAAFEQARSLFAAPPDKARKKRAHRTPENGTP